MKPKKFTRKQMANIVLAARGKSECPAAKKYVRKLDRIYKLKKK